LHLNIESAVKLPSMNKIRLLLFFLILCNFGIAQENTQVKKKVSFKKQVNAAAKVQINQLKNGALLVRLKTKKPTIAALRKIGREKQAIAMEEKQAKFNVDIIKAFKLNFNFCPTYFFYSDYSIKVREKEFDKVVFLNDSLKPDSSIKFLNTSFLVAEFGVLQQDTARHISHYTYESAKNFSLKQETHYYGGPSLGLDGLIISSDQLIQLRHPFPYFNRTLDPMPKSSVLNRAVRKMNKKLHKFYTKKNKK
jgi:hypothetical protein